MLRNGFQRGKLMVPALFKEPKRMDISAFGLCKVHRKLASQEFSPHTVVEVVFLGPSTTLQSFNIYIRISANNRRYDSRRVALPVVALNMMRNGGRYIGRLHINVRGK